VVKTQLVEVEKLVYVPIDKELLTLPHQIIIDDNLKYIDLINNLVDAFGIISECRLKLQSISDLTNKKENDAR
jgi:hypothetical protein